MQFYTHFTLATPVPPISPALQNAPPTTTLITPPFILSLFQLVLQGTTKYFSEGSIIADSREAATGLMVITSGLVGVELPMDSDEADEENRTPGGKTLLYVFSRGYAAFLDIFLALISSEHPVSSVRICAIFFNVI